MRSESGPSAQLHIAEEARRAKDFQKCESLCLDLINLPTSKLHPVHRAKAHTIMATIVSTDKAVAHLKSALASAESYDAASEDKEFKKIVSGLKVALQQAEMMIMKGGGDLGGKLKAGGKNEIEGKKSLTEVTKKKAEKPDSPTKWLVKTDHGA